MLPLICYDYHMIQRISRSLISRLGLFVVLSMLLSLTLFGLRAQGAGLSGDINGDSKVNFLDFSLLFSSYGAGPTACLNYSTYICDLTTDSKIDSADFRFLVSSYETARNTSSPPGGTLVKTNCAPDIAAPDGTLFWHSRNAAGIFDIYGGDSNCNGTTVLPAFSGHRGVLDITKDGRYLLLTTAVGADKTSGDAEPGRGSGNSIQLYDRQTGKLSTLLAGGSLSVWGVIWPIFNADGTKITWSQMVLPPILSPPIGVWQLHVADINLGAGTMSNDRSWQEPGVSAALYEPYGWLPGTNKLIYMATAKSSATDTKAFQLFTLPDSLPANQGGTRISPQIAPFYSWETASDAYHEFAHFTPNDPNTLYTSIGTAGLGADLWKYDLRTANTSGVLAQPTRISYFGGDTHKPLGQWDVAGYPPASYSLVTNVVWINNSWMAAVCRTDDCASIDAYRIVP